MADATGVGSTGEIMTENLNQKEMLSALADGQLSGNALTQALEFSSQDEGRETWQLYQLVGDVLRSPELARPVDNGDFLARLRTQLAQEAAPVAQATVSSPAAPAQPVLTQFTPPPQAANDSVFRWKMVAGLASLAAVATLVWSAVGGLGGPPAGAQMAAVPAPVTASVSVQAPAELPPRRRRPSANVAKLLAAASVMSRVVWVGLKLSGAVQMRRNSASLSGWSSS